MSDETAPADSRNIKLTIAYDGTDFCGWQVQNQGERTVQGEIERALAKLHKKPVSLTGSGRTDSGVHASGQVANFYTDIRSTTMEAGRFVPALNALLPRDVRILAACDADKKFHARFSAVSRTYRYFFIAGRQALPHEARYALQLWRQPCVTRLNDYARALSGEIDFTTFCAAGDKSESKHRYVYSACFFVEGDKLVFEITANAFLMNMVRSLAGSAIFFDERGVDADEFRRILASRDRGRAGPTAPPHGLFLRDIKFS